jgi:hypothetical protein
MILYTQFTFQAAIASVTTLMKNKDYANPKLVATRSLLASLDLH